MINSINSPVNYLLANSHDSPNVIAIQVNEEELTYRELYKNICQRAHYFLNHGVSKGSLVAIYTDNDLDFIESLYALWILGAVALPMNIKLKPESLRSIESIVTPDTGFVEDVNESYVPTEFKVYQLGTGDLFHDFEDESGPEPESMAVIMFTSGTSGIPKAVPITHEMIATNARLTGERMGLNNLDRILLNTPACTTSSIIHLLTLVSVGGSIVIDRQFAFGASLIEHINNSECTGFGGVPVHFRRILAGLESGNKFTDKFNFMMNSGEHLSVNIIEELYRHMPDIKIFCAYGLTEVAGRLCILSPDKLKEKTGSVGYPLGDMEITIRDTEHNVLPVNEEGEVFVKGPMLMKGYLGNRKDNMGSITKTGFATGDLGHLDNDGFLFLHGRNDDVIKVGGEKVSLNMIEDTIIGTLAFHDFTVVPYEDIHMGLVPCVCYVLNKNVEKGWKQQLLSELGKILPSTHIPAHFIEVDSIPRTSSGKTNRREIMA